MEDKYKVIIDDEEDIKIFISLCISCRASFKKILKHHKNNNLKVCDEFCEKYLNEYNEFLEQKRLEEIAD